MAETTVRIESVRVEGRYRKDLGDIEALAKSIATSGLINAITITKDGRLVAGERRLAAARQLGWQVIDARVVDNLSDAVALLTAERDENTERKEMTVSERVALAKALEDLEKPRAAQRLHEGRMRAGKARHGAPLPAACSGEQAAGNARDIAGAAAGLPSTSYFKARIVVEAAADPTLPDGERAVAAQALAEMDATGNVTGSYEKVKKIRAAQTGAPKKAVLATAQQQRRAFEAAVVKLSGLSHGLRQIESIDAAITKEEAARWMGDLSEARLVLERLIKRLKEFNSAEA